MSFASVSTNFVGFPYLACEVHRVYTCTDSGKRDEWAKEHGRCHQLRAYVIQPCGYEPFLDPLEALASIAGEWNVLDENSEREKSVV